MRRIQISERKKLRGIPRRLRSLSKWPDQFAGFYFPRSEDGEKYCHWKIPVISSLVNPPHTTREIQSQCMSYMLRAASLLAESLPLEYEGYYRVACLFTLPWMHQSEVTIFYDSEYYLRFYGETNEFESRSLSSEFGITIPNGFVERGCVVNVEGDVEEWWCIGQPI